MYLSKDLSPEAINASVRLCVCASGVYLHRSNNL